MSNYKVLEYLDKSEMNTESLLITDFISKQKDFIKNQNQNKSYVQFNVLLVTSQKKDDVEENEEWQGFVASMKEIFKNGINKHTDKITKQISYLDQKISNQN